MRIKTRKLPKHNQLYEREQDLLSVPRWKAFQEDTACASREHMKLTAAELERTLDIALQIVVNTNPDGIGFAHISADMWNYMRVLVDDGHRTLFQLVKEQLEAKYLHKV